VKKLVKLLLLSGILLAGFLLYVPAALNCGCGVETRKKMVQNNLRLIDNAMDRVMLESNYQSIASIRKPMVDPLLDSLDIAHLKWPTGAILITKNGAVPIDSATSIADWNDFLTNEYLTVRYENEIFSPHVPSED